MIEVKDISNMKECTFVTDTDWKTEDYNIINGQDDRLYIEMR